jgi:alpha-methylacyl-CoA racemase
MTTRDSTATGSGTGGPLRGVTIIELAGRGPGPFAGMMLADMGAEVVRIERPNELPRTEVPNQRLELTGRGRRSIIVDLKSEQGREVVFRLVERADALYEGFRPGVVERLGIGPEQCLARNPRLIYARATGWGQDGPLAHSAGHDINYIALAGALEPIGRAGAPPTIPLNLVGDFAGGGQLLAFGIVCGILEARSSGQGQVIDAAMVDGSSLLMSMFHGRRLNGTWRDERGTNYIDSGAPYYDVYLTKDDKYVAVGAIESKFHRELFARLGFQTGEIPDPLTRADWPALRSRLEETFRTRTRDEWSRLLEGTDSCFSPVLALGEVADDPHHRARESFVTVAGVTQPAPAPRFSRTVAEITRRPPLSGEHSIEILRDWEFGDEEITALCDSGAVVQTAELDSEGAA